MNTRDELIERIADAMECELGHHRKRNAEAALSVVETATSTCPECGGKGKVRNPSELGPGMHVNTSSYVPCPSCGGQPGPRLAAIVLGLADE